MTNEDSEHGKTLLAWNIPEYEHQQRPAAWYFAAGLVGIALVIWSVLSRNYLFAVIIVMVGFILAQQAKRKPVQLECRITEDGIAIGEQTFYDYRQLKQFWIIYNPPSVKRLYVSFRSSIRPELGIPLEDQNPLKVREALAKVLREDTEREGDSVTETLGRILKI